MPRAVALMALCAAFALSWACATTNPAADGGVQRTDSGVLDAGMPVPDGGVNDAGSALEDGGTAGGIVCGVIADAGVDLGDGCGACLGGSCCEDAEACASKNRPTDGGLSPCARFIACAGGCLLDGGAVSTCQSICTSQNIPGFLAAAQLLECAETHCSSACPF